jgi:hypothetical protein
MLLETGWRYAQTQDQQKQSNWNWCRMYSHDFSPHDYLCRLRVGETVENHFGLDHIAFIAGEER